ncbi:hypothetical protein EDC04DRAFT_2625494 [Pisolithus marmoratus]|nr:hypothetical protein EDC04DRAFT_2625494 [Pisolithus marmoratus]
MQSKTFALSFSDHVPPSTSTVQPFQTLARHCHLDHSCYTAAHRYKIATIDGREAQCPTSSTGKDFHVSISELTSCPIMSARPQVPTSSLVGHLNREQDSAQFALSMGYIASGNEGSCIASPLVNQGWDYEGTQDHASHHVTNNDVTLPSPYTTGLLQSCAIGLLSSYPQENENISTFGDLANGCSGPATELGSLPLSHGHTSGLIHSTASSSGLASSPFPSVQELHLSDDLNSDYVPLPPQQIQTDVATPAGLLSIPTIIQWGTSPMCLFQLIHSAP